VKTFFAGLATLVLLQTGCVGVVVPGHHAAVRAAPADDDCPPGHRWSDGRCHDKGKGHDPAKHRKD
jgi:hypothetical protein